MQAKMYNLYENVGNSDTPLLSFADASSCRSGTLKNQDCLLYIANSNSFIDNDVPKNHDGADVYVFKKCKC